MSYLNDLIRNRRSVFPEVYNGKPIPEALMLEILENANWAPTHRLTQPWRFKIMQGEALQQLSSLMEQDYKTHTPEAAKTEAKLNKAKNTPLKCSAIIAICVEFHEDLLPEWEEIASTAMAVQNLWLSCAAHQIGSYWGTPGAMNRLRDFLHLTEKQRCIGFFYMGYYDAQLPPGKRAPIADKIEWL